MRRVENCLISCLYPYLPQSSRHWHIGRAAPRAHRARRVPIGYFAPDATGCCWWLNHRHLMPQPRSIQRIASRSRWDEEVSFFPGCLDSKKPEPKHQCQSQRETRQWCTHPWCSKLPATLWQRKWNRCARHVQLCIKARPCWSSCAVVFTQNICTPVLLPLTQLALLKERNQHVFIRAYLRSVCPQMQVEKTLWNIQFDGSFPQGHTPRDQRPPGRTNTPVP